MKTNSDHTAAAVIRDFGREWAEFDQSSLDPKELRHTFDNYFDVFPWEVIRADAVGFDLGAGSGRWAKLAAPRVGTLHCVDASLEALRVAKRNLAGAPNCTFTAATAEDLPLAGESMDFGYSLGVLHHTIDPAAGLRECVRLLRPGAPFLLYLYYRFDNRPAWYGTLWRASDYARQVLARSPHPLKLAASTAIAVTVYWPLARAARLLEKAGASVANFPLAFYRHRSFYTMRTDSLDRFGTRIEHRFTASEIRSLMESAGLRDIRLSPTEPFWCAVGWKRAAGAGNPQ